MCSLVNYLQKLKSKGFHFGDDVIGFIYFGKQYTGASDELAKVAIEFTLKAQRTFDGSFYISLLETFQTNKITSRQDAVAYVKSERIIL